MCVQKDSHSDRMSRKNDDFFFKNHMLLAGIKDAVISFRILFIHIAFGEILLS